MKKWMTRLGLISISLLVALGIVVGAGFWMLRGTPDWYALPQRTDAERAASAEAAEQKLQHTQQFFEAAHAQEIRTSYAQRTSESATAPTSAPSPQSITVSFTQDELNSIFAKWTVAKNWKESYERFVLDPVVILHEGRLILAARVREMDSVVSLHFEPKVDDRGRLHMETVKILGGKLRLPESVIDKPRRQLTATMQNRLPEWQEGARIDATGGTNGDAVAASLAKLALNVLHHEPAEAVLFLPLISSRENSVPVRLTNVRIEDKTLTLTVEPLGPTDRAALLQRIREPYNAVAESADATPGAKAGKPSTPALN